MHKSVSLPLTNENGYYEIRLESIGGFGANLCGKMLGELGALYLDFNSLSFSSYGSEKRGSPVKAYIRWCEGKRALRINSPVTHPHLLGIFHEGLIGTYPVLEGVSQDTKIVLNTPLSPDDAAEKHRISMGELFCLDALSIAMKCKSRINMVMLGAIAKASGFLPLTMVEQLCLDTIGKKYPALMEANREGLRQGYEAVAPASGERDLSPLPDTPRETFVWGYDNAPIGGVNPRIGSTISNDLSPSREGYIPLFLPEKCINCGLCDSTCPDMVFQFAPGIYKDKECMVNQGVDYYHCKGCLRCVEVCPTNALVMALEKEYPNKPHFISNQHLLPDAIRYQKAGANSWITSDSYLDEKRVDGGVV
ncbi:MAG: 2-oxoacid:acceptor oxidoreductase family protein [Clostridiales bacterium]|nr:2-oxoacid:acceptor oxidoreductase family protein [Clostridiales bacterium]